MSNQKVAGCWTCSLLTDVMSFRVDRDGEDHPILDINNQLPLLNGFIWKYMVQHQLLLLQGSKGIIGLTKIDS
jgi:hypothetical protein